MNFENPIAIPERELFPLSLEEISREIERLCGKENPKVIRTLEDEKGVYLHEIVIVDDKGDASLFSYRRSGNYTESKTAITRIDVAYFKGSLEDGNCIGGDVLSNYNEMSSTWADVK